MVFERELMARASNVKLVSMERHAFKKDNGDPWYSFAQALQRQPLTSRQIRLTIARSGMPDPGWHTRYSRAILGSLCNLCVKSVVRFWSYCLKTT